MDKPSIKSLQRFLDDYRTNYRRSDFPALVLSEFYDLFPQKGNSKGVAVWPDPWPSWDRPGVYFFFDSSLDVLYIGKVSWNNTLGARLATYCGYGPNGTCVLRQQEFWKGEPRYVAVIPMIEEFKFEASALEEFLITRLKPIDNKVGIS